MLNCLACLPGTGSSASWRSEAVGVGSLYSRYLICCFKIDAEFLLFHMAMLASGRSVARELCLNLMRYAVTERK